MKKMDYILGKHGFDGLYKNFTHYAVYEVPYYGLFFGLYIVLDKIIPTKLFSKTFGVSLLAAEAVYYLTYPLMILS